MKKMFSFCLVAGFALQAMAQRTHFVYLQTDDQAPFYVRMGDRILSSSAAGYLILPNLVDSTYLFGLGFAKSTQPETRFAVAVNQNDKGFLVKNFPEGLALFDLQDLSVVRSVSANRDNEVYETKTDKFSATLSKAADDPSLLKVSVAKKEDPKVEPEKKPELIAKKEEPKPVDEKPKDTVAAKPVEPVANKVEKKEEPILKIDSLVAAAETKLTEETKPASVKMETPDASLGAAYKPSVVSRRSESSTTEGLGVVYLDKMEDKVDTIRILIPPSKFKVEDDAPPANASETQKDEPSVAQAQPKVEPKAEAKTEGPAVVQAGTPSCSENASEKDFMKLRKNMAAKASDEDMISEAKKVFKNKCFTTEQIRYLSTLFLSSSAKYQFFDAAYSRVSDRHVFPSLQSELKDEYFLKRFKALVGE